MEFKSAFQVHISFARLGDRLSCLTEMNFITIACQVFVATFILFPQSLTYWTQLCISHGVRLGKGALDRTDLVLLG